VQDVAVPIDLGISALFPASCNLGGPDAGTGIGLVNGPVQAYTFIAPTTSAQTAIWAEEAYYAFGFGNADLLLPWNQESLMFIRPVTKSTLVATAFNILVPPAKWKGTSETASTDVLNAVINSTTTPDPTIGILGDEVYDANRGKGAKVLAYRAYGQKHAYFPDSDAQSFDRRNVRDGHYTLWSPTVYITQMSGATATNPNVQFIIDLVNGKEGATAPDGGTAIDGLKYVTASGLTPDCAMGVTRQTDGGDLSLYTPAAPCNCYFLSQLPGASATPAGCTTCTGTGHSTCGAGMCRHGFCEAN
jgi:hypothetical protein